MSRRAVLLFILMSRRAVLLFNSTQGIHEPPCTRLLTMRRDTRGVFNRAPLLGDLLYCIDVLRNSNARRVTPLPLQPLVDRPPLGLRRRGGRACCGAARRREGGGPAAVHSRRRGRRELAGLLPRAEQRPAAPGHMRAEAALSGAARSPRATRRGAHTAAPRGRRRATDGGWRTGRARPLAPRGAGP